jgi:hypothetical protein
VRNWHIDDCISRKWLGSIALCLRMVGYDRVTAEIMGFVVARNVRLGLKPEANS